MRATIAAHVLGLAADRQVGDITLHAHQRDAVGRLRTMLNERGGALLADDVGLGKTYAALAVARSARCVVVVAPAAVREHWLQCALRTGAGIVFHSMESLSRRGAPGGDPDLVIVDEAHHFRNAQTRRFSAVRRLCARARVLLLSATPVQNTENDLRTLLSLFLGSRANVLSHADAARFIVRRVADDLGGSGARLPCVIPPRWLPRVDDADCLDRILALPTALSPIDGRDGGALVTFTLIRQWASSRAALRRALRRRVARGLAMVDALRAGRMPTRAELASWCQIEDAQQLAFPELVNAAAGNSAAELLRQVERHVQGVRDLMDWLSMAPNPDAHRMRVLLSVLEQHPRERVIAFSEYAATVSALFRLITPFARAAVLTHAGGRLASGAISRAEILDRFSVGAGSRSHQRDRIDLLLTTDVLGEGVSLPDASVVVHLDLAWNPARLEQRVGRLRRVDSTHRSIAVYVMQPPASAERMLALERRLRIKQAIARRAVGATGAVLPGGEGPNAAPVAIQANERIAFLLRSWQRGMDVSVGAAVAAVRSYESGALACVRLQGAITLLAMTGTRVTEDVATVERLCAAAGGESATIDDHVITETRARIDCFLVGRDVSGIVAPPVMYVARVRRALLQRAECIARRAPRENRPRFAALFHGVRAVALAPLSAGSEAALDDLARAELPDEAWLRAINEFAATHTRRLSAPHAEILALLILRSD